MVHVNNSPDLHGPCTSLLLSEIMSHNGMASRKNIQDQEMKGAMKMDQQLNYNGAVNTSPTTTGAVNVAVPSPMTHIQGKVRNQLNFEFFQFRSALIMIDL